MLLFMALLIMIPADRQKLLASFKTMPTPSRSLPERSYNCRMKFRIRKRHWIFFAPLFAINMLGLVLTSWRSQLLMDIRIVLLMLLCSALIAFVTALVLVNVFERTSSTTGRANRS
jgi:predicted neutral ceramidase superfamily lipid hydrolase